MWWRRSLIVFGMHCKAVMNSRRQFYCRRPTMSGLRFIFKTSSVLRTTIMPFIRSASNYGFVRKNYQKRTRLKRLFKLCFPLIGSYNTNIGPKTTRTMMISFVIYSRLRSMMSLLLWIITNVVLGLLLSMRSITVRRSLTFLRIIIWRKMVGPLGADAIGVKTDNLQRQWKMMVLFLKGVMCSAGHVVVSSILLRNVVHPSTDEDITPLDINNNPPLNVQGPITRARAR
jgi:hypothetical protein